LLSDESHTGIYGAAIRAIPPRSRSDISSNQKIRCHGPVDDGDNHDFRYAKETLQTSARAPRSYIPIFPNEYSRGISPLHFDIVNKVGTNVKKKEDPFRYQPTIITSESSDDEFFASGFLYPEGRGKRETELTYAYRKSRRPG